MLICYSTPSITVIARGKKKIKNLKINLGMQVQEYQ